MVVAISRARIRQERAEDYYRKADEMAAIAAKMPGFVSYKAYTAPDGERVSIHEWESAEHLRAWREHPEHRKMQAYGRENLYLEYTLYVCDSPRQSRFVLERAGAT
jgi:heme-degrading monooxygenase HmoA